MKNINAILAAILLSNVFNAQADIPILGTDIKEQDTLVSFDYSSISMSQFFDDGFSTEEVDSDMTGTGASFLYAGKYVDGVMPVVSVRMRNMSSEGVSTKQFITSAGLKLGENDTSKILKLDYAFHNDSDIQDAISVAYVFRGLQNSNGSEAYEFELGASKSFDSDFLSGGDILYFGGRSKLAIAGNNYFVSNASLGLQTDTEFSSGAYTDNGLILAATLGLAIAPASNVLVNLGVSSNMQYIDYYDQFNNYLGEESRFIFGVDMGLTVAF